MENEKSRNDTINFMYLLGLIFVTLKLYNIITWSWWIVTLPFWLSYGIILFASFVVLLIVMLFSLFN